MNKAEQLLLAYEDMTWDNYVTICDAIVRINPENLEEELTNLGLPFLDFIT